MVNIEKIPQKTQKMRVGKLNTTEEVEESIKKCLRKQAQEGDDLHYTRLINNATKYIKVLQIHAIERRLVTNEQRLETYERHIEKQDQLIGKLTQTIEKLEQIINTK